MLGMLALLFFAITGLLLNHEADWFELDDQLSEIDQPMPSHLLNETREAVKKKAEEMRRLAVTELAEPPAADSAIQLAELKLVEFFRTVYDARGESRCDLNEDSIVVDFKAPGRSLVAEIRCQEGTIRMTSRSKGLLGKLLDLHRGKNKGSGWVWSLLLDTTCVVLVFLSATGLFIWSSLKTRRLVGLAALGGGIISTLSIYLWGVP
jgi:hypothetical protein